MRVLSMCLQNFNWFYFQNYISLQLAFLVSLHVSVSGLTYVTDKNKGNCSVRPINRQDFDVRLAGANDVRIRNSKEFFYFDSKRVTYEGVVSHVTKTPAIGVLQPGKTQTSLFGKYIKISGM